MVTTVDRLATDAGVDALREGGTAADAAVAANAVLELGAGADDYTAHGELHEGDIVRRPGVARALAAIAAEGRAGFYEGEFGRELLALGSGEYAPDDLSTPCADWVEPLRTSAWG